jgi:hypothetical protein
MIGWKILAFGLALALAARFIECLCSKQEREATIRRHLMTLLRNVSLISILLYIYFLIFVIPTNNGHKQINTSQLATMSADLMVGGGARLKEAVNTTSEEVKPMVWPSQQELSEAICKKVRLKHVPSVSDF